MTTKRVATKLPAACALCVCEVIAKLEVGAWTPLQLEKLLFKSMSPHVHVLREDEESPIVTWGAS